jgi:hypothetical protein
LETLERQTRHAQKPVKKKILKYAVGVVGAALVFLGVFFVCGAFINPFLPAIFRAYLHLGGIGTNNWLGVILGSLAAASSFRATLKMLK